MRKDGKNASSYAHRKLFLFILNLRARERERGECMRVSFSFFIRIELKGHVDIHICTYTNLYGYI